MVSESELSDLENELVRLIRLEFKKLRDKNKPKKKKGLVSDEEFANIQIK
jgi:hypothetical protein